jgi:hypothetical protein
MHAHRDLKYDCPRIEFACSQHSVALAGYLAYADVGILKHRHWSPLEQQTGTSTWQAKGQRVTRTERGTDSKCLEAGMRERGHGDFL